MSKPANKIFDPVAAPASASAQVAAGESEMPDTTVPPERTDFPCSVAQERFWLLDRLEPGNSPYNVAVRWRLEGRVSTSLLERAWLKIIERHEILRTVFFEVDGAATQRVLPQAKFRLNEIDLSDVTPELQQVEGDRIGVLEARAPFDLASGPILRVTLLRFSATSSIILVTTHQIVSDGWSIGVMAREMGLIYQALSLGQPIPLEPLAIQYADYSLWQLEWLRVRGIDAETQYWSKQLAGVRPFKVWPDRPRPAIATTRGAIASRVLPRELTNKAQTLTAERGATLFAAALASLCATLARFTHEGEIIIGTQVSDRDQVELEPMIGQFVNSLILRNDLSDDPSFNDLIDRIRETSTQALEHRHIPIERLLGMIKGEHGHANSPPVSVNFIFQKTFIQNTAYSDFSLIDMPSLPTGAIYDLNFFMVERPDGWRFSCQYNTDQFETPTADRLLGYVQSILESAVGDPKRRVSELTLCPPGESRVLHGKLNDTRTLYPRELTLSKLFEGQVMRAPLAIAVSCDRKELSYGDLDASANRFAAYLATSGVARGARVGVCLPASMALPICLLGLLKAGATFVPLDPADPPERRRRQVAAANVTAIIGHQLQPSETADARLTLIDIEVALAYDAHRPGVVPLAPMESDAAACLLFTPGGCDASHVIGITHRNLSNLIYSLAKRPGVSDRDVLVVNSTTMRDRTTLEIFLSLLTGARLVIATAGDVANGRTLLHLLQRTGATIMFGDARTWMNLLRAGWIGFPALKMLCETASLSFRLIDQLAGMDGELWALYGRPASPMWSAIQRLKPKQTFTAVGEPIANTSLYVLDSRHQIAAVGATGELFAGGDGFAEFGDSIADPFSTAPGVKLFRTGDLARLRAGGQIEYLRSTGSGFTHLGERVEPEEIEREILCDPNVAEAAAVQLDNGGESAIVAYLVPRGEANVAAPELIEKIRARLSGTLPGAMIPSLFAVRATLPRTGNGALDRRALQMLRIAADDGKNDRPSGEIEERLAEIWRSMLDNPSITVSDNFFEMGGHSLLAARMLAQVERAFGRRIQLATLFSAPTIHGLAKALARSDPREFDFRQMVKIQPQGSKPPLIAINNTGIYYGLAKSLGVDQPVTSLQLFDPSVKSATMPQTLEEVAAGYVDLIRRVQPQGPYQLIGWCVAGALTFEIARRLVDAGHEVSNLFLVDSWVPRYGARLPKLRGAFWAYTLSWQFIFAEWRSVIAGELPLSTFFANRTLVKELRRLFGRKSSALAAETGEEYISPETYDQWLLGYLQQVTGRYEPKRYPGKITLFRSREEPTGWFFQPNAGWDQFASGGVDLHFVDGNHFTMFKDVGAAQMAARISITMNQDKTRQTVPVRTTPTA
jgi:non-ribosomal peptide synthetase component F/thioesterase domain-containing protein